MSATCLPKIGNMLLTFLVAVCLPNGCRNCCLEDSFFLIPFLHLLYMKCGWCSAISFVLWLEFPSEIYFWLSTVLASADCSSIKHFTYIRYIPLYHNSVLYCTVYSSAEYTLCTTKSMLSVLFSLICPLKWICGNSQKPDSAEYLAEVI